MTVHQVIEGLEFVKASIEGDVPDNFLDILDEAIKRIKWGADKAKEARRWKEMWLDLKYSPTSKGEKE